MKWRRAFGPGLIVTAAFIGPGTVYTASKAGGSFGYSLVWTLLFAVLATVVLQEMAARLGLVARTGLGEAVRSTFRNPWSKFLACGLVLLAITFGNAAYQMGNLTGATQGVRLLTETGSKWWTLLLAGLAFGLLMTGKYKWIERGLIALVLIMSLVFILTAVVVRPDLGAMAKGFVPSVDADSLATVIALIGTTVVPYNLFLHASSVRERWSEEVPVEESLREARADTMLSIPLGGLITLAVLVTAATAFYPVGFPGSDKLANQLEPLLGGPLARMTFAGGLFAAGLTSAITAPLAAAYATAGIFGWKPDLKAWRIRAVWMAILLIGTTLALTLKQSPAEVILIAQIANGLLLPIIAAFLLVAVNRSELMGQYKNRWVGNLLGVVVLVITIGLGAWTILTKMGIIQP